MSKHDPHTEDDILVSREKILELFDPPPSKSAFFEWVNKGLVVKARGLTGYYLLNATRKKVKLPLIDVVAFRQKQSEPANRQIQIVYVAMAMIVPEIVSIINEYEFPEVLTPREIIEIRRLIEAHREPAIEQGELQFRMVYCRAVLDAEKMLQQSEGSLSP
jgi:hypothetical protein